MNEIVVISEKGNPVTTSLQVAEYFGKQHKHVIEAIKSIIQSAENSAHFYYSTTYIDSRNREQEMFVMNRDGFSLLVMGFTGPKALKFKIDFINAFNKMEQQLKAIEEEKARYHDRVLSASNLITTSIVASDLGISARALNQALKTRGIIYKQQNGTWMIAQKYREQGFGRTKTHTYSDPETGKTYTSHTLCWTERGREFINRMFEEKFLPQQQQQRALTT